MPPMATLGADAYGPEVQVDVVHYGDAPQFAKAVGADIAMRGDRALVFVHGFNNGFDDGIYRLTQIAHDTK